MTRIVCAILARNEASRYLSRVLANAALLCDETVVLDDGSTDGTVALAREAGATVFERHSVGWWGGEGEGAARAQLWALASERAGSEGWVYVADADHELCGVTRQDMAALASAEHVTGWAWPLCDCWDSEDTHRVDGMWVAWKTPRVWMARAKPDASFVPAWQPRDIHVGHFPHNLKLKSAVAPGWIRHLGYWKEADRQAKARKYLDLP